MRHAPSEIKSTPVEATARNFTDFVPILPEASIKTLGAPMYQFDRVLHRFDIHIVKQYDIRISFEGLLYFSERFAFDLNFEQVWSAVTRSVMACAMPPAALIWLSLIRTPSLNRSGGFVRRR